VAGNLKRIEKTSAALAEELIDLGDRFNEAYDRYLKALAPAVQQQLVLAAYYLCTRGYPDRFLALSMAERAAVQNELQQLARHARASFENYFDEFEENESAEVAELESDTPATDRGDEDNRDTDRPDSSEDADRRATPSNLLRLSELRALRADELAAAIDGVAREAVAADDDDDDRADDRADDDAPAGRQQSPRDDAQLFALALQAKLQAQMQDDSEDGDIATPSNLLMWQRSVESDIVKMLHDLSLKANQLLQACDILPQEFPPGLFEAIGQQGDAGEAMSGTPNVLKLTIEAGKAEDGAKVSIRMLAIELRLSEIEFSDAAVSQPRHAIRKLLAELSGLRKRYTANQREYTIAKAESAWRSTWSESGD